MNDNNPGFKLDVKIAKMLKLSFEIDHTKYGTKDIVTGRVIFKETSMKMKLMMIQIIRKEIIVKSFIAQIIFTKCNTRTTNHISKR